VPGECLVHSGDAHGALKLSSFGGVQALSPPGTDRESIPPARAAQGSQHDRAAVPQTAGPPTATCPARGRPRSTVRRGGSVSPDTKLPRPRRRPAVSLYRRAVSAACACLLRQSPAERPRACAPPAASVCLPSPAARSRPRRAPRAPASVFASIRHPAPSRRQARRRTRRRAHSPPPPPTACLPLRAPLPPRRLLPATRRP
jgi:hypothetical protein